MSETARRSLAQLQRGPNAPIDTLIVGNPQTQSSQTLAIFSITNCFIDVLGVQDTLWPLVHHKIKGRLFPHQVASSFCTKVSL